LIRTQVQLTDEQYGKLKKVAAERGVSMAEVVREALDGVLERRPAVSDEERRRKALAIAGRFASGLKDVGTRHDEYLAEEFHR